MNHIYRSIWNPSTCTYVVTSELVSGRGKAGSTVSISSEGPVTGFRSRHLACAVMFAFGAMVQAQPTGGVVASGSASIGGTSATMTVTQTTPRVAINWQSFGIQAGQSVQFIQPSSSSVALNRVVGSDPSSILGNLSSNGQVFLVNPSGILFGPNASVNVGGLVASTLNISDADFMSGFYRFSGAGTGAVVNQGLIQAAGGYVALLGGSVSNQGVVMAQLGTVVLAAGNAMTLDVTGDQLLNVAIDQGVVNALVSNGGLIQADGGQVLMTTQAAGNMLANAVNTTGIVQAQSLENRHGTIVLLGSMDSGTLTVSGTLDVRGGVAQSGGRVVATAHHVGLFNAHIDASGDVGGGTVLIGGDYQGHNPAVPHASAVYMSQDSAIHADANSQGDGGRVVLWANGSMRALGQVSARGGAQSGDGGLVETSGHALDVMGIAVDTLAAKGQTGAWLLDPADVTISSAVTTDATKLGNVYEPNSGVSAANVNVADLVTALGSANVTVTTANTGVSGGGSGDIHVNAALTWTASNTLTLTAARDVKVNQAITGTDGSLVVNAGNDVTVSAAITTTTGHLSFNAGHDVNLSAATTITTGNLNALAGRNVNVSAASTITTGNMVFRADNDGTGPGASAGTVVITCLARCLTVTHGALDIRFNPVTYANTGNEILDYGTHLTGAGTLSAKAWVFGQGDDKTYDGSRTATVSGLKPDTNQLAPIVALGAVSNANFDTKHVGTAKPITLVSTFTDTVYALFANLGDAVGTYQARANVLVRPLTVSATTDTRVYNGTLSSVAMPTVAGLQAGDTLNGTLTQTFANKDVLGTGNSTLVANGSYTVSDGNAGNNYTVAVVSAPGTIKPVPLTITANDVTKVFGQTPVLSGFTTSTMVNSETVGSVTQTSLGQAATSTVVGSSYAIVASDATGGTFTPSNYTISYVNGALTVTPAVVVQPVVVVPPDEPPVVDEPAVDEPDVVPPVVVVPDIVPVVVPPVVVEPPVVVPPIVVVPDAVPVVVPPVVIEPPVVVTPVVVVPEEVPVVVTPPTLPSVVNAQVAEAPPPKSPLPAANDVQAMPRIAARDASPALLVVAAHPRATQGPVVFPGIAVPVILPAIPPTPMLQQEKPPHRLLVLPLRTPKQDRN